MKLMTFFFFFFHCEGKLRACVQHRVGAGRGRGVVIGVHRSRPQTCNDHLMNVVSLGSSVCQGRIGKNKCWAVLHRLQKK